MNPDPAPVMDFYAVFIVRDRKSPPSFLCNVLAGGRAHALKTARNKGFKLPRSSYARHIGREGYRRSLAQAFHMG